MLCDRHLTCWLSVRSVSLYCQSPNLIVSTGHTVAHGHLTRKKLASFLLKYVAVMTALHVCTPITQVVAALDGRRILYLACGGNYTLAVCDHNAKAAARHSMTSLEHELSGGGAGASASAMREAGATGRLTGGGAPTSGPLRAGISNLGKVNIIQAGGVGGGTGGGSVLPSPKGEPVQTQRRRTDRYSGAWAKPQISALPPLVWLIHWEMHLSLLTQSDHEALGSPDSVMFVATMAVLGRLTEPHHFTCNV